MRDIDQGRRCRYANLSSGGSMRISDIAELMEGYKREGIPSEPYYW